jgi:hypothetical protein
VADGKEIKVPANEIVPGDVVILQTGDRVPGDIRLLEVNNNMACQEAARLDRRVLRPDRQSPSANPSSSQQQSMEETLLCWWSVAIMAGIQVFLTYTPGLNSVVFGMGPTMDGFQWLVARDRRFHVRDGLPCDGNRKRPFFVDTTTYPVWVRIPTIVSCLDPPLKNNNINVPRTTSLALFGGID